MALNFLQEFNFVDGQFYSVLQELIFTIGKDWFVHAGELIFGI